MQRNLAIVLAVLVGIFGLIQIIPYGMGRENPPVLEEPNWDSPETRAMVQQSCFNCHSNETEWPWYSRVAPISWVVQNDVEEGRKHLNFSEWGLGDRHENVKDLSEVIEDGEMPLPMYLRMHPEARLTDVERARFIEGLTMTISLTGSSDEEGGHGHGEESDEHGHDDDH